MNYRPFYGNKEIYYFSLIIHSNCHMLTLILLFSFVQRKKKTINKKSFQVINRFLKLTNKQSKR